MANAMMSSVLVLALMSSTSVATAPCQPGATTYKLTITVNDYMNLFIDGLEKGGLHNANTYNKPDELQIPCNTKVIAVHGKNSEHSRQQAGILASSDGNYILSNASWKCTNVSYSGWQNVDYNDSFWSTANMFAANAKCAKPYKGVFFDHIEKISYDARWIWLRQWNGRKNSTYKEMDVDIFCRKSISTFAPESTSNEAMIISPHNTSSCQLRQSFRLSLTADDSIVSLYVDGVKITNLPNADVYDQPDTVDVTWDAKVIAVHARNFPDHSTSGRSGILASSDGEYVMTDASWKCTNVLYSGWQAADYNDSFWPFATTYVANDKFGGQRNEHPYSAVWGISEKSYWIWHRLWNGRHDSSYVEMDNEVYCRKTLDARCGRKTYSHVEAQKDVSAPSMPIITPLGASLGVSILANVILISALCIRKQTSTGTALNKSSACGDGDTQENDQAVYVVFPDPHQQEFYEILNTPQKR